MSKLLYFTVIMLVGASVAEEQHAAEGALEALVLQTQRGQLLLLELEHQQLLSAKGKAHRLLLEDPEPDIILLQQKVQQVEAELAFQQQQTDMARTKAASIIRSLRADEQQAAALLKQQAAEADEASRRLCEALTEGHGDMSLLCRGAKVDMSPELAKVLNWLARQQGKTESNRKPWILTKLAMVWIGWLVVVRMLWRLGEPEEKTHKMD